MELYKKVHFLYVRSYVFTAYIVHTEYCTQTNYSYNYEQQLQLRNSALDFLKQPLITVECQLYVSQLERRQVP